MAHAHLIREGHAQLTVSDKGVYLMASYPVEAFLNYDDNGDQLLDERELSRHQGALKKQVMNKVSLVTAGVSSPLEGLVLNLSHGHQQRSGANYLIIMGRFKKSNLRKPKVFRSLLFKKKSPKILKLHIRINTQSYDYQLSVQKPEIKFEIPPSVQTKEH